MPADPFRRSPRRRSGALVPTLIVLGGLAVVFALLVTVWTERMWFDSLNFGGVFTTRLLTQVGLFVVAALIIGAALILNVRLAYRHRPRSEERRVGKQGTSWAAATEGDKQR